MACGVNASDNILSNWTGMKKPGFSTKTHIRAQEWINLVMIPSGKKTLTHVGFCQNFLLPSPWWPSNWRRHELGNELIGIHWYICTRMGHPYPHRSGGLDFELFSSQILKGGDFSTSLMPMFSIRIIQKVQNHHWQFSYLFYLHSQ